MNRAIIGTIAAVLLVGGIFAIAQPTQSTERNVLDRMVGVWNGEEYEEQGNGDEELNLFTLDIKWVLEDQYIEARGIDSDGKTAILHLINYDSYTGGYNMWSFTPASSKPMHTTMWWNESEETLSGTADLGNGMTIQLTTRFIGNDRMEYSTTTKDTSGNVLDESSGSAIRKE